MTTMVVRRHPDPRVTSRQLLALAVTCIRDHPDFTVFKALDPSELQKFVSQELPDYPDEQYRHLTTADPDLIGRLGLPLAEPAVYFYSLRESAVMAVAAKVYYLSALHSFHGDDNAPAWFLGCGIRNPEYLPYPPEVDPPQSRFRLVDVVDFWAEPPANKLADPSKSKLFVAYDNGNPRGGKLTLELRQGNPLYPAARLLCDWRADFVARQSGKPHPVRRPKDDTPSFRRTLRLVKS